MWVTGVQTCALPIYYLTYTELCCERFISVQHKYYFNNFHFCQSPLKS
jgi:hypothetical protein